MFPLANFGWRRGASGGAIISLLNTALQWLYKFTSPATAPDKTTPAYYALYVESPAAALNGSTTTCVLPESLISDVFTQDMTHFVRFNSSAANFRESLIEFGELATGGGNRYKLYIKTSTGQLRTVRYNNTSTIYTEKYETAVSVVDGEWHSAAFQISGGIITKLYFDGVLQTNVHTDTPTLAITGFALGSSAATGVDYFTGQMVDYRFIPSLPTAAQMLEIHNGSGFCPDCRCDIPMCEASGQTSYDVTGNGNDGAWTDATWTTQNVLHYLAKYGFYVAVAETPPYIPALLDGSGAADGVNPISNPAGLLHNWGPHSIKNDDYNVVDILASGGCECLMTYDSIQGTKPSWASIDGALLWDVTFWKYEDYVTGESWEWSTSYTGTFPPVGIPSGTGDFGSAPVTLTYNELLVQGGEWATIGTAEIAAHPNFLYNSVFKYTDDCFVSDMLTWSIAYEWAASDFYRVDNRVGDVCYEPSLIPYPVTAGTGIGPSEDWYTYDGTNIYLVEDA